MKLNLDTIHTGIDVIHTAADVLAKLREFFGGAHPDFTFAREGASWSELLVVRTRNVHLDRRRPYRLRAARSEPRNGGHLLLRAAV